MSEGTHPNISSIIRMRDTINLALYIDINYRQALRQMDGLMRVIEKKDRDNVLHIKIIDELKFYNRSKSLTKNRSRLHVNEFKYGDWYMEINDILYDKEYLLNKKYMTYPANLPKSEAYKSPLL